MAEAHSSKTPGPTEIAQFLRTIEGGEQLLADDRLIAIAHSLKAIIDSRPAATSDSAALISEALIATFGKGVAIDFHGKEQFYSSGARAMRKFLVNQGRAKSAELDCAKPIASFSASSTAKDAAWSDIVACDAAMVELEQLDARMAHVAVLRYFGGLSEDECAIAIGRDKSAVQELWLGAVNFLKTRLSKSA
jgi:DNA-directed RNA polymerase specialized sigma24 family protein